MSAPDFTPEQAAALLATHPDYRVTCALPPIHQLPLPEAVGTVRRALVVDTETTSLDWRTGKIIQIAACPIAFDTRGCIVAVEQTRSWLSDPGEPLSREIVRLTGLTDAALAGQRIDDAAVAELLSGSDVIIAHNAGFDRPWWEARYPVARERAWACSMREIDSKLHGQDSRSLGALLDRVGGWFNTRHRADADVDALVALLTAKLTDGRTACEELLQTASRATIRFTAMRAPFAVKDALRSRGYRWIPQRRAWSIELPEDRRKDERAWLAANAACPSPTIDRVTWFDRHR